MILVHQVVLLLLLREVRCVGNVGKTFFFKAEVIGEPGFRCASWLGCILTLEIIIAKIRSAVCLVTHWRFENWIEAILA